jgi:hypothetical protein
MMELPVMRQKSEGDGNETATTTGTKFTRCENAIAALLTCGQSATLTQ